MEIFEDIARSVSRERLRHDVEWFAGVRRDTGGPGEEAAADYIAQAMRDAGVPVTVHQFQAFMSFPGNASLRVVGRREHVLPSLTHSFACPTGADGMTADLALSVDGKLDHAAGKIVLIDGIASPMTVQRAMRADCAGLVFANPESTLHNVIVSTIWGTPEPAQRSLLPTIPVVSVNAEGGALLRRLLAEEARVRVGITTEVRTGWFASKLPEVRIPGGSDDTFILVGTHYCSWSVGVTDNATGTACLMELARLLWTNRDRSGRGIRLCWWPGHSHGRYAGSTWYADTFFTELAERGVAYYNIDSPGVKNATELIGRYTTAEMEGFVREMLGRLEGTPSPRIARPGRASDQSFAANGLSSFSIYSFMPEGHPDRRSWSAGCAGGWWWHSEADTLDKADLDVLARDTRNALRVLGEIATMPVLPMDFLYAAKEILALVRGLETDAGQRADLTALRQDAEGFLEAAERLDSTWRRDGAMTAADRNALSLRLTRVLNPVVYSQHGRFKHDAAELLALTAKRQTQLPGVAKAAMLPSLAGQSDYGFLQAEVVREINRARTALREATRLAATAAAAGS